MNWVTHLEYLQAIIIEFDVTATLSDEFFIWYLWNGLKPLIWAQLDEWDRYIAN